MLEAYDLAFSYNSGAITEIIGLANFRPGLTTSDPGKSGWWGEGCSILVWAARRQLRVASFFWPSRASAPLAAAARSKHERRAGQPGRRVNLRPQKMWRATEAARRHFMLPTAVRLPHRVRALPEPQARARPAAPI